MHVINFERTYISISDFFLESDHNIVQCIDQLMFIGDPSEKLRSSIVHFSVGCTESIDIFFGYLDIFVDHVAAILFPISNFVDSHRGLMKLLSIMLHFLDIVVGMLQLDLQLLLQFLQLFFLHLKRRDLRIEHYELISHFIQSSRKPSFFS